MLKAQGYMSPTNSEGRIMTDDVANEAALRYICNILYEQYAILFMDEFIDQYCFYGVSLVEYTKMKGLLPESWNKDLKQTEALLRSTADILVCKGYKMPNFMQERIIYGLLEYAKVQYSNEMEEIDEERKLDNMISSQYREAIENGVKKHPEDYDYIIDTEEDEKLSEKDKLERKIEYALDLVVNPHNYEDVLFMDLDFFLMDEYGISESEIADTIGPMFGINARTEEQQKEEKSTNEKVSFGLIEKKVYPFFYNLATRKTAFTGIPKQRIREFADVLMALKPTTYIRYMYEDMLNGQFNPADRWIEDSWKQESEFLETKKQ